MSLRTIDRCKFARVSPTQKLVLLALADCHNEASGQCNPSVAFLMGFSGLSNRAIATAIAALEESGWISVRRKFGAKSSYSFPKTCEPPSLVEVFGEPSPDCETSEPPAKTSEPNNTSEPPSPVNLVREPVNLLPKPVKEVHTKPEGTGSNRNELYISELYDLYPRKKSPEAAKKAIRCALKSNPFEVLKAGVEAYAKERRGQDPKYTKHPATWFNQKCWLDEPDTKFNGHERPNGNENTANFRADTEAVRREYEEWSAANRARNREGMPDDPNAPPF